MEPPPPPPQEATKPQPLTTYTSLLETLSSFLAISFHTILYTRSIYPKETFLRARAYNFPVYQNRHPVVCRWINDAVAQIIQLVPKGVDRVSLMLYDLGGDEKGKGVEGNGNMGEFRIHESYFFDLSRFPKGVKKEDFWIEMEREGNGEEIKEKGKGKGGEGDLWVDIEEQLRGAVGRWVVVDGSLRDLPPDCRVGVTVELEKGKGGAVLGHPQPWIPSAPSQQRKTESSGRAAPKGKRTIPIRSVEAGEFIMEMYIEHGMKEDGVDG